MSERSDFTASARVRVTVEVLNLGPYGAEWKAGDIHDQVAREAQESVKRLFGTCAKCGKDRAHGQFRVVGEPQVEIVSQRKVKPSDADGNNPRCTAREVTLATVLAEAIKENQELIANCGQNQIQGKVTT